MSKTAQLIHDVEEEKKSKKKGFATLLVSGVLAATLCMGGVFAYLTATDSVTNNFGLTDSYNIDVIEPNWDTTDADGNGIPDAADNVLPTQTISKDPQVKNLDDVDAYVFLTVDVPTKSVQLEGESAPALHELLSYETNDGWTEVVWVVDDAEEGTGHWEAGSTGVYNAESGMTTHTYVYDTALSAQATSGSLFDDVTIANYINGQIGENVLQALTVNGHSIQALGFDSALSAWSAYAAQ